MSSQLTIHTEQILRKFANLTLHKQEQIYRIWLVSPWITYKEESGDPLVSMINAVRTKDRPITLITRKPDSDNHAAAIHLLESTSQTTTYVLPALHSKLYILQCDGFRAAFFGSPNFTVGADKKNHEISMDLRSTFEDPSERVTSLIYELGEYASYLRNEAELYKAY